MDTIVVMFKTADLVLRYKCFLEIYKYEQELKIIRYSFIKTAIENVEQANKTSQVSHKNEHLRIAMGQFQLAVNNLRNYDKLLAYTGVAYCALMMDDHEYLSDSLHNAITYTYQFENDDKTIKEANYFNGAKSALCALLTKNTAIEKMRFAVFSRYMNQINRYHYQFFETQRQLMRVYFDNCDRKRQNDLIKIIINKFERIEPSLLNGYDATNETQLMEYLWCFGIEFSVFHTHDRILRLYTSEDREFRDSLRNWLCWDAVIEKAGAGDIVDEKILNKLFSINQLSDTILHYWKVD